MRPAVILAFFPYLVLATRSSVHNESSEDPASAAAAGNITVTTMDHGAVTLPVKVPLYIGGMFPYQTDHVFGRVEETVNAAIDHVNNLDGILDGYELRIRGNWTEGKPDLALRLLYDFIYVDPPILMSWGPMLSSDAVVVNEVASKYNIIQATLASSPTILDHSRFPLTIRLGIKEDDLNQPRLALMKRMGWKKAAIVFEDIEYFRSNILDLEYTLTNGGITILTVEAITDKDQHQAQIKNLQNHDARIIFAHFYERPASKFFCEVYRLKAYGPQIIWILNGWINDAWWRYDSSNNSTCTPEQLEKVLQYHLALHGFYQAADVDRIDFGGIKPYPDQKAYIESLLVTSDYSARDVLSQSYDSMMVMAMALNASVEHLAKMEPPRCLQDFQYGDTAMREVIMQSVRNVHFYGATSQVSVDENATRTSESLRVVVKQLQNTTEDDLMKHVLLFVSADVETSFERICNNNFIWHGENIPVDGVTIKEQIIVKSLSLRITVIVLDMVGVSIALVFIFINIRYRNRKAIKISSPQINNLTAVGGLLLYSFVVMNSIDSSLYGERTILVLCHVSTFLLSVGFSLAFGGLFVKTFRIHSIFTKAVTRLKKVELPDTRLIMWAFIPVIVDIILITLLITLDENVVEREKGTALEDSSQPEREIFLVPVRQYCTSSNQFYFVVALYVSKGVLLVFGIFLAWETRRITVAELNDSKYLAMSVYIVALTVAITLPTLVSGKYDVNFEYVVLSVAVIFANTTVLCLVFLPKMILFWRTDDKSLSITMMKQNGFVSSTVRSFGLGADSRMDRLTLKLRKKIDQLETSKQELRSLAKGEAVLNT
ncbi:gamma-aminobutyric acid type B receptor subunit 2-like [Asterias amurensis]|uniref:gamma-aminobutyric acid type B receptor subunit 2-like n=1 Tax=Asterias amurensis TaxID=7602 RepID=UPI003AB1A8D8